VYCALKTFQDFRTGRIRMALFGVFSTLLATALVALVIFARWGQDDVSAQGPIAYLASEGPSPKAGDPCCRTHVYRPPSGGDGGGYIGL